jgi:hypothetical protein
MSPPGSLGVFERTVLRGAFVGVGFDSKPGRCRRCGALCRAEMPSPGWDVGDGIPFSARARARVRSMRSRQWRGLRPLAPIVIPVALVAPAAIAIVAAGGVRNATAAAPAATPAGERIADDVFITLAGALPVALAAGAAVLTRLGDHLARGRRPAGQQAADAHGSSRLQQPPSPGARHAQLSERIKRLVLHGLSLSRICGAHRRSEWHRA